MISCSNCSAAIEFFRKFRHRLYRVYVLARSCEFQALSGLLPIFLRGWHEFPLNRCAYLASGESFDKRSDDQPRERDHESGDE
jgi:hypothetical protein